MYKIVVYNPLSHADKIRQVLAKNGAGKIGNYQGCSFSVKGVGRFQPCEGASPYLGEIEKMEEVEEERIETICEEEACAGLLEKIKKVHPYEEPAIDVYPLIYP